MYVGVKEIEAENPIDLSLLEAIRKSLLKTKWAVGLHREDPEKLAIVLLRLLVVLQWGAGAPIHSLIGRELTLKPLGTFWGAPFYLGELKEESP